MFMYCKKCVQPNTRPRLAFDEHGVCGACRSYESRANIDWEMRKKEFVNLIGKFRSKDASNFDCVVGVSGGKDSTYQIVALLNIGLKPLAVTNVTCDLSALGRKNLDNLNKLGVDRIEVATNSRVRAAMNRHALRTVGDISWPEHAGIFSVPLRISVQLGIPLQVWGENPSNEYGGSAAAAKTELLTGEWLAEFSTLNGLTVEDFIGVDGITRQDLISFFPPSAEDMQRIGVTGVFLGYYFPWDGLSNAIISQGFGLKVFDSLVEGSLVNYENLDNHQTGIHDYFMFLKFGFGRATSLANTFIRRGRLERTVAAELIKMHDGRFPWTCLGKPLQAILADIDMELEEFMSLCDKFTNSDIFECDSQGNPVKDKHGNLTKKRYA
jgi:N-acetyl sugar amidotransferase